MTDITNFIKGLDTQHLVLDGSDECLYKDLMCTGDWDVAALDA